VGLNGGRRAAVRGDPTISFRAPTKRKARKSESLVSQCETKGFAWPVVSHWNH
jgi:hypothetical protein